ncbi:MAG: enoyl-CoA hydratase/isomerase family protein [Pseudomonadota bacterium]
MSDPVIIRQEGGVGQITLNRPDALHALNQSMCEMVLDALAAWRDDPAVFIVLVDHAEGTRGFCAGGDIRMLAESGAGDASAARAFFNAEYRMNVAIKTFPKPYVSILDGVTMGGGVGLSVHGSHRIATERTLFAMPETGIGLFPDVGGGWFLPRLYGQLGTWLALTGARLKGAEVQAARIATHFVPSELVENLRRQLLHTDFSAGAAEMVGEVLNRASHAPPSASFAAHLDTINTCFAPDRAEEIEAALAASDAPWAADQLAVLRTKSPETVKTALRQLREGARCETFQDNMAMEYRIGWRKVQSADFAEGVRAVIVDKDNAPQWQHASIADVPDAMIDAYFAPLGEDELRFD